MCKYIHTTFASLASITNRKKKNGIYGAWCSTLPVFIMMILSVVPTARNDAFQENNRERKKKEESYSPSFFFLQWKRWRKKMMANNCTIFITIVWWRLSYCCFDEILVHFPFGTRLHSFVSDVRNLRYSLFAFHFLLLLFFHSFVTPHFSSFLYYPYLQWKPT